MVALPSFQHYQAALKYYRIAFDLSHSYNPGINAATLAFLDVIRERTL